MRPLFLLILSASCCLAEITVTGGSASVNADDTAGVGPLEYQGTREDAGPRAAKIEPTGSSGADGVGNYYVDFDVTVENSHLAVVQTPDYVQIQGAGSGRGTITGSGSWNGAGLAAQSISGSPGSENIVSFTITNATEALSIRGHIAAPTGSTIIRLEQRNGASWSPFLSFLNSEADLLISSTIAVAPGEWRLRCTQTSSFTLGMSVDNSYSYEVKIGNEPPDPVIFVPGEYSDPEFATAFDDSPKLLVRNPAIVSETDLANGTTEVKVTAELENTSKCPWTRVSVSLNKEVAGAPTLESVSGITFGELAAQSVTSPLPGQECLTAIVANSDLPAVRAAILDGSRFTTTGSEMLVFVYPPISAEAVPVGSWTGEGHTFTDQPFIPAGTILLEWDPLDFIVVEGSTGEVLRQGYDQNLPLLVSGVSYNELARTWTILGEQIVITEYLIHGTMSMPNLYGGHEKGYTVTQKPGHPRGIGLGGLFPAPQPFHFNKVNFGGLIDLSGSFTFRPGNIGLEFEMEDGQVKSFLTVADYTADCTLLLETPGAADNTDGSNIAKERTIFNTPLFTIVLPAGFTFCPVLSLDVGALVSTPTSLSVPLTTSLNVSMKAGVKDGRPFYESGSTVTPLHLSDPGLFEDLFATAEAYIDCELKCLLGLPTGGIKTGPTLGARAVADFTLAPLDDPWWSLGSRVELHAGVELNLAGVVTVIDEEAVFHTIPLPGIDAGGPLLAGRKGVDPGLNPGIRPITSQTTRWARNLLSKEGGISGNAKTFLVPLEGSEDVIVGQGSPFGADFSRVGPDGALQWTRDGDALRLQAVDGVAEPDGGFTLLSGKTSQALIARFDAAGEHLWTKAFTLGNGLQWTPRSLLRDESGYYILGRTLRGGPLRHFPAIVKLDPAGDPLWQQHYEIVPGEGESTSSEVGDMIFTSDGNIVLAGTTGAHVLDLAPASQTVDAIANFTGNGLALKVNSADGAVLWARVIAYKNPPAFNAVAESPAGDLYLGGRYLGSLLEDFPSLLLTKLGADGVLDESTFIGHPAAALASVPSDAANTTGLPHNGETLWDEIRTLSWADGALWMGGQIGIYNAGSNLADGSSAFTARIDENLSVSRFVIHAGRSGEHINNLLATDNGLLTLGTSKSFAPWPSGSTGEADNTPPSLMLMKLPWEGAMRFHSISAGAQDQEARQGSYYVYPRQRAASQYASMAIRYRSFAGTTGFTEARDAALVVAPTDISLVEYSTTPITNLIAPFSYKALEYLPKSLIVDQPSYLNWYQLDPAEDSDSDGIDTDGEFFLGTDPAAADLFPFTIDYLEGEFPTVEFTVPRAKLAAPDLPIIEEGSTLNDWMPSEETPGVTIEARDSSRDLLRLTLPATYADRFYRMVLPD